jgi:hypothetical protein
MKAAVVFTGSGPILILTSHDTLDHPDLIARLAAKGIGKFVAHEIPLDEVRSWYGPGFERIATDETEDDALRIVDVDGRHIFCHLRLSDLGPSVRCEAVLATAGS